MKAAVQVLKKAEELKQKLGGGDILSDNDTWNCHQRLQDLYQQLLLIDLEYALDKKVEQDLWNYVFKNQINVLQMQAKDRKNPQRSESQENLVWFLEASSGFYLQLIQELCETFDLDISCRRKGSSYGIPRDAQSSRNVIVPPHKSSCLYICQHCLVHLGDIARYRNQSLQAETWYRHAAELVPSNGQPYNQLAILEAAKGDKLSTVFYYVRSIAVKCPFPVAATNLQKMFSKIANDEFQHDGKNKLSVYDYVTAFLQFHSLIHLTADLSKAQKLGRVLATNLTILIATESLTAWKLIQMMAINLFAVAHATRGLDAMATTTTTTSIDKQQHEDFTDPEILSEDEQTAYNLVLELIASMLNSMLLLVYTMKDRHELKAYYALPVVKLVLEWLRQDLSHLKATSFTSKLQIWPSLCKLLNAVQSVGVSGFDFNKYTEVPLPEDWDLQSFVPMERAHRAYRFRESLPHLAVADEQSLRASRLVTMGRWLSEQEVYGVRLVTAQQAPDETLLFEAVSPQTPSCDVLEQLEAVAVRRSYEEEEDEEETTPLVSPTLDGEAETMDGSAGVLVDAEEVQTVSGGHRNRAKGGGGRPSVEVGSDGVGSIFGDGHHRPGVRNGGRERKTRQNVALQTIMQKKNIVTKNDHNGDDHFISTKPKSEGKQVTFKTPSPSPPASSGGTPPLQQQQQQHQPPQPHAATATPSPVFHGDMSCFPPLLALPYAQQQQQRQALNLDHNGGPHINSVSPNPVPNAAHNRLVYTNLQNSDHAYQLNNSAPPKFGYFGDSGPGRSYAGHPPTMPPPGQMTGRVGPPSAPKQLSNGDAGQHPTVNGLGQPPLHHLQQQQQQQQQQHRVPAMGPVDLSSAYPQPQQQQHGIVFGYPSPPKPNPASNPVAAINGGVLAPLGHLGQQKQSPEQQAHFPVGVFNPAAPSTWFVPPGPPMGPMAPYKPPPNLDQLLLQFNSQQRAQQQQSGNMYAANQQQHNFGTASNPRFPPRDVNSYLYHHMMTSDHSMPPYAPYPAPQQQQHSVPLGSLPPTGRNSVAARKLVNGMSDPTYPEPPAHMAAAPSSLGGSLRQNVSDKHRGAVQQQQQQSLSEVQSRAGGGKGMSEGGGSGSKSSSDNVASTYSLFNSPWSSGLNLANVGAKEHDNSNHAVSVTKDLGGFLQPSLHSLWSGPGPSPLERLLEQQKQKKDPAPH